MCAAVLALAWGWSAASARADGDPASDVLATQPLFLAQDAGVPPRRAAQLASLLDEAQRSGAPIRVALIASPADLGSVTELFGKPQSYAEFLGQELALLYRGPLLVLMPNGFGLYGFHRPASARAAIAGVPLSAADGGLGPAVVAAVRRLAAASGHPLALPSATASAAAGSSRTDTEAWIAFAAGWVLIAVAWVASLRARPLGRRRQALQ